MCRSILLCFWCLLISGCVVNQLRNDQDRIRLMVQELQTNQLMDNLVRASNGMPIIQLDYSAAQTTVTMKDSAMLSDGNAVTHSNVLTTAATTTVMRTRMVVNTLMSSLSLDHTNEVAVGATPLTTSVEAYNAYLQFLAIPGSLQVSPNPPPPGAAHICKQYGKEYYWVPFEFKDQFFDLGLATTSERGRLLIPPPEEYAVSLTEVITSESKPIRVVVKIDKFIPNNDTGIITFNKETKVGYDEYRPDDRTRLFETDKIVINLNNHPLGIQNAEEFAERLKEGPIPVLVRLKDHRPSPPTRNELLDSIEFQSRQFSSDTLPACEL
jgi:hypothetical protein